MIEPPVAPTSQHSRPTADGQQGRQPVDANELRQGLVRLRDMLAVTRQERDDARRELEAVRTALTHSGMGLSVEPARLSVRVLARRMAWSLWSRAAQVLLRATPPAVVRFVWRNPLFDRHWYLEHYPDVHANGRELELHYRRQGVAEGRDPNAYFDTSWYLARYRDVAASGMNPLDHYLLYGASDGRDPGPRFDTKWYAAQYPDVRLLGMPPLLHFLRFGSTEGRSPRPGAQSHRATAAMVPVPSGPAPFGFRHWSAPTPGWSPSASDASALAHLPTDQPIALVIDDKYPRPDRDAGSVLMGHYVRLLQGFGYHVHYVAMHDDHEAARYRKALEATGATCLDARDPDHLLRLLRADGHRVSVALLSRPTVGGLFLEEVMYHCRTTRTILLTHDLHFLRLERECSLTADRAGLYDAAAMKELETHLARTADATIVVSDVEMELLKAMAPVARVYMCPLIQDGVGRTNAFDLRSGIAFVGGYRHPPNVDAVVYFLDEVWPLVRAKLPGVSFYAIGADMPEQLSSRLDEGFVSVGHVDDLTPWFERVRLTVAPLRYGAGVKGKVLTSLAHGVPCVVSPVAAEGIAAGGSGTLLADHPDAFAEAVVGLHRDPVAWQAQSDAAIAWIDANVSSRHARARLRDLFIDLGLPLPSDGDSSTGSKGNARGPVENPEADRQ